jgi:hypothetical protein
MPGFLTRVPPASIYTWSVYEYDSHIQTETYIWTPKIRTPQFLHDVRLSGAEYAPDGIQHFHISLFHQLLRLQLTPRDKCLSSETNSSLACQFTLNGARRFLTVCTKAPILSLSRARKIQSTSSHPISWTDSIRNLSQANKTSRLPATRQCWSQSSEIPKQNYAVSPN